MTPVAPEIVTFETDGHVAVITLNRPEARNAVNEAVAVGLEAAIDRLEEDPELWIGILAANTAGQERPVFCAGADLKEINVGNGAALGTARGGFAGFTYRQRRKPVIVAVDGLATAGGCEIVLAADIVVATTRSAFGLAEVKRNLVAGAGGLFRLPRVVGLGPALDVILTGDPMPADRAYQLGLVARLAEPGAALGTARQLAARITASAPLAVWESRAVAVAATSTDDDTLKRMTDEAMGAVMSSEDLTEGLTAFIEKREPVWKGR